MLEQIATEAIRQGLLGIALVASWWYFLRQERMLRGERDAERGELRELEAIVRTSVTEAVLRATDASVESSRLVVETKAELNAERRRS